MIFTWHQNNKNNKKNNNGTIAPTNNKIKNAYQTLLWLRAFKKVKEGKTTDAKLHNYYYCYEFSPTMK